MKEYYFCPHCKVQIQPVVVTPNSILVLKFLSKIKGSVKKYTISTATMNKYGHSCAIILENLQRDRLIDIDYIERSKNKKYQSVYYKINKFGKLVLKRWKKNMPQKKLIVVKQISKRKKREYLSSKSREAI